MSANGHSGDTGWFATGFSPSGLASHYKKHGKSMGFSSAVDYNNAATDFMNSDGSDVESFTDSSGTVYKYNSVTHEFCMAKSDGTVITYFIPDNPDEYWEGQVVKNDNDF